MRMITTFAFALVAFAAAAQTPSVIPPPPDVAAPPKDATKTRSGLVTKVLQPGTATDHPRADEIVTVHYTGWTTDGKMFDSSVVGGTPRTFALNRVIPGWTEGVQLMVPGEKRRLWVPEALAYNKQAGRPAGMLVFDVELLQLPTRAPADVKAPPADAKRTASGLAYKVLKAGTGRTVRPKATDMVMVNYTGWYTDGKMFDSSIIGGQPITFPLNGVIKGWTEGVQLMVEGEKTRFWIPDTLAYKGMPDKPQGTLVFDIELLRIN
jgi:FKBP-type peptidyl-prolyl cis-trans isomerase